MGANADVIKSFWEAFGRRDIDDAIAHADDGAEIVIPETVPWGGTYRSPGGFQEMIGGVLRQFEDFRPSPEGFLEVEDDQVAVPVNVQGRAKSGNDFSGRALWLYRVRDGKIARAEVFMDTAAALEALR
jgi:ketosteroid isomerase-like protein